MKTALDSGLQGIYPAKVPDKEGNGFGSLINIKAHRPRNAAFLRAYAAVRPLGGGSGEASACRFPLVYRSSNPAICRPPRLEAGRGVNHTKGVSHD